jgi:hypothetical protein
MPLPVLTEAEAKAIMSSGLGQAELEFVMSLTAPLYWIIREADRKYRVRNGSAFFLDAGQGPFAVTANHVIEGWKQDRIADDVVALQLGADLTIDLEGKHAIIAADESIDIATFRISSQEIASIGKTVLTGYQKQWPPGRPQEDRGVYFGGFPGVETVWLSLSDISFGASAGSGVASSISETDVSSLIERENLTPVFENGLPPENFDFGGMSGGPMLAVIESRGLRSWALAGVIYQGPNPSGDPEQAIAGLEIIKARRAHFILPDGTLDIRRCEELSPAHARRNHG